MLDIKHTTTQSERFRRQIMPNNAAILLNLALKSKFTSRERLRGCKNFKFPAQTCVIAFLVNLVPAGVKVGLKPSATLYSLRLNTNTSIARVHVLRRPWHTMYIETTWYLYDPTRNSNSSLLPFPPTVLLSLSLSFLILLQLITLLRDHTGHIRFWQGVSEQHILAIIESSAKIKSPSLTKNSVNCEIMLNPRFFAWIGIAKIGYTLHAIALVFQCNIFSNSPDLGLIFKTSAPCNNFKIGPWIARKGQDKDLLLDQLRTHLGWYKIKSKIKLTAQISYALQKSSAGTVLGIKFLI